MDSVQALLFGRGLTLGAQYAMIAYGLVLIYRHNRIANFAQGQVFILGGITAVVVQSRVGSGLVPAGFSLLAAIIVGAGFAYVIYILAQRALPLMSDELSSVIATLAIAIASAEVLRRAFGPDLRSLTGLTQGSRIGLGLTSDEVVLITAAICTAILAAVYFGKTNAGRKFTAIADNPRGAEVCGLNVKRLQAYSWVLAGAVGGFGGFLVAAVIGARADFAVPLLIGAFIAAVIGGLGSVSGALVGGITVGMIQVYAGYYLPIAFRELLVFAVLVGFLWWRPQGLFQSRVSARL